MQAIPHPKDGKPMDHDQQDPTEQTVEQEMEAWSRAHPRATFAEMEHAVEERMARLRARLLRAAAEREGEQVQLCPHCGRRMISRGAGHERTITVRGEEQVELHRSYLVCPACSLGLFPPG